MRDLVMYALVAVLVVASASAKPSEDYIINEVNGIGYKIMYQAKPWSKAKEKCKEEGGKLAVPKSEEEFRFIQKLVRAMHYPSITDTDYKLLAWLGINNLDDYRVWRNIDGEKIEDTGYHTWAGLSNGQGYSDDPREPHCVGIDASNPGLRDFWCHRNQPYVCQKTTQQ